MARKSIIDICVTTDEALGRQLYVAIDGNALVRCAGSEGRSTERSVRSYLKT